jgi:uncharacterized protein CbrC (UPF0167 family)
LLFTFIPIDHPQWVADVKPSESAFRYFCHPHQFSTYSEEPRTCETCGETQPGYKGPFYGAARVEFVCEECLVAGRLAEIDVSTSIGDPEALGDQLREIYPGLDETEVEARTCRQTDELEHRTPRLITWQDLSWPTHCGDYCRFIKEVGRPDLNELSPDGNGRLFLGKHLRGDIDPADVGEIWERIRPNSPKDSSVAYAIGVYLFQCLECGECTILWDLE